MRIFALVMVCLLASCGGKCKVTSECESGEHCDFTTGECLKGCESNDDCEGTCDVSTGRCRLMDRPPFRIDSGTSTTTSTTPDASLPD